LFKDRSSQHHEITRNGKDYRSRSRSRSPMYERSYRTRLEGKRRHSRSRSRSPFERRSYRPRLESRRHYSRSITRSPIRNQEKKKELSVLYVSPSESSSSQSHSPIKSPEKKHPNELPVSYNSPIGKRSHSSTQSSIKSQEGLSVSFSSLVKSLPSIKSQDGSPTSFNSPVKSQEESLSKNPSPELKSREELLSKNLSPELKSQEELPINHTSPIRNVNVGLHENDVTYSEDKLPVSKVVDVPVLKKVETKALDFEKFKRRLNSVSISSLHNSTVVPENSTKVKIDKPTLNISENALNSPNGLFYKLVPLNSKEVSDEKATVVQSESTQPNEIQSKIPSVIEDSRFSQPPPPVIFTPHYSYSSTFPTVNYPNVPQMSQSNSTQGNSMFSSPFSQCFVLNDAFDPTMMTGPDWHNDAKNEIIRECNLANGEPVFVFVDRKTQVADVYVKCASISSAYLAANHFIQRKKIAASFIPLDQFHQWFPKSLNSNRVMH